MPTDHLLRIVADSANRPAWLRARSQGITATDAAKLSSDAAIRTVAWEKRNGTGFTGNSYTEHGKTREPAIARWVKATHGIASSGALFHASGERRHLATPDGIAVTTTGEVVLAEIKTTSKPWRSIPRGYLRQVWWQQYVLGADRTLLVWEQHTDFVPVDPEPQCRWIDRDENEIYLMIRRANTLLDLLGRSSRPQPSHPYD